MIQMPALVGKRSTVLPLAQPGGRLKDFYRMEKARCAIASESIFSPKGRIFKAILQLGILLLISFLVAGSYGFMIVLSSLILAKLFIEMLNYFQHYGIVRVEESPNKITIYGLTYHLF